jgi:signal peptidase I
VPSKATRRRLRSLAIAGVLTGIACVVSNAFVLQAFNIPSRSMAPTLHVGDRVVVDKLAYYRAVPARGDVLVFEWTTGAPTLRDGAELEAAPGPPRRGGRASGPFIKRVIAVGGDTVEGWNGSVYVNGRRMSEPYLRAGTRTSSFGPVVVPADHIFVMGDNRANSNDSRSFGPVPVRAVVGRALWLVWPPQEVGTL